MAVMLVLVAAPAAAERAAVVRLGGDTGIAEPLRREAVTKLNALLRRQGLDVMPPAEAARRATAAHCEGTDCESRLRTALGVDLLVTVGLWAQPGSRGARSVVIGLVTDATYFGNADVGSEGLAHAIDQAFAMARARQALGPGPWLRVDGEPRGALVVVDGTEWGVLPNEAHIAAGEHTVAVRLDGYVTEQRRVRIPEAATEPVVMNVTLNRAPPGHPREVVHPQRRVPPPPHRRVERPRMVTEHPLVGPLVLGGVGLGGVGVAVGGLLTTSCDVEDNDNCLVGTKINTAWTLVYGVGGAVAIGAAIAWYFLGATERPVGTTIGIGPGSLYLRKEF